MLPKRFTSSNPLARSSAGSLPSSEPGIGKPGEAGSREKSSVTAIKSARRRLGPVNGIGFSRKVVDTVRQRRGSSKCIRTKATAGIRFGSKGRPRSVATLTNVHNEFEDRNPGFLLTRPQKLEGFVRAISPDAHSERCALRLDILAISFSGRRDGMWRGRGKDRGGPPRRAEK